jgi:hypothetical protein
MACPLQDVEILTKGSVFLRTMASFLENKAQTTLLKINFPPLDLSKLKLKNCKIIRSSVRDNFSFFYRFTFQTTIQYLNEKMQSVRYVFVDGPENFKEENFPIAEGKKKEISTPEIKDKFEIAKKKVREAISPDVEKISSELDKKLEAGIERIKMHYKHQFDEIDSSLLKAKEQLADLEAGKTSGDVKNIPARINKIQELISELEKKKRLESSGEGPIAKEEKFFINDEINKHSLGLDVKLMNTTIFYYPVFNYSLMIKSEDSGRQIELIFDPLKQEVNEFKCESCQVRLKEIFLCASGHLVCDACKRICRECGKEFCTICIDKKCSFCGKSVCRKCLFRCGKCGLNFCKTHIKNTREGSQACLSCVQSCSSCGQASESLRKCPSCSSLFCASCREKTFQGFCVNCSSRCPTCQKFFPRKALGKCAGCNAEVCNHIQKCPTCRKQLCARLKR